MQEVRNYDVGAGKTHHERDRKEITTNENASSLQHIINDVRKHEIACSLTTRRMIQQKFVMLTSTNNV